MATKNKKSATLNQNVEKIQKTAQKINKEVVKTSEEVMDDFVSVSKERIALVKEIVKETIENIDINKGIDAIKETTVKANNVALKTADEVVDGVFSTSTKWLGLTEKVIKNSNKLAERQQKIVFDTLENVKGQFTEGVSRFKHLVSKN